MLLWTAFTKVLPVLEKETNSMILKILDLDLIKRTFDITA
jgi:hypothetical protein